jgi:hypothetical protein
VTKTVHTICTYRPPAGSWTGEDASGAEQGTGEQSEATPEHNWRPNAGDWSMCDLQAVFIANNYYEHDLGNGEFYTRLFHFMPCILDT